MSNKKRISEALFVVSSSMIFFSIVDCIALLVIARIVPDLMLLCTIGLLVLNVGFGIFVANYAKQRWIEPRELELEEASMRERKFIDNAVDVICLLDFESRFLSVSPSVEKRWGYAEKDLVGHKMSEFLHSADVDTTLSAVLGAKFSIDQISFENRFRRKNGEIIDLNWTAHWSVKDNGLFCIARDISERKHAEAKLEASQRRLRSTLESMPIGIVCTTQQKTIEFTNQTFASYVNRSVEQLIGTQLTDWIQEKDKVRLLRILQMSGESSAQLNVESSCFALRSDSEELPVEITSSNFNWDKAPMILFTFSDITQRREVEQFRREFVAMINHDLRSPLGSLLMQMERMERDLQGEQAQSGKETCKYARMEIERLLRLVNELLDLEKIENLAASIKIEEVALLDIIESSVSSVKAFADGRGITIHYEENEFACFVDRSRIIQVLVNFLFNAIKFSPIDSTVEIEARKEGNEIGIYVTDQGRGIPPEKASLLFKRYRQLNAEDERTGSGLGLSISKAIIEAHNGGIGCQSDGTRGSTFWFKVQACRD